MSKRQQLIETAFSLFYQHGIHAIGINQILAEAGVAKKTLYSHFDSKDALVSAVLDYRDHHFITWLAEKMATAEPGKAAILAIFDALDDWFNNRTEVLAAFNGCFFINTCAEYGDPSSRQHEQCQQHKIRVRHLLSAHIDLLALPQQQAETLLDTVLLLKEGAIVTAQVQQDKQAAEKAKKLVESYL